MKHGRKAKQKSKFFCKKARLETDEIIIERAHWIRKKEGGERRTIIAKCLHYKQREKLLNKYKELKLWEDQIYKNEDSVSVLWREGIFCLNAQR